MSRSPLMASRLARRIFPLPLLLAASGCGFQPQMGVMPGGTHPADMGSSNVRMEVFCRACQIGYVVGEDQGEAEGKGSWTRTFRVNPRVVRMVSISVNPSTPQDWIGRVTIRVNGAVRAESDGTSDGRYQPVNLTASVH